MVRIIGSCLRISEDTEIRLIHLLSIFVRVIPNLFTALQISSFKVFFQISETLHQRTVFSIFMILPAQQAILFANYYMVDKPFDIGKILISGIGC